MRARPFPALLLLACLSAAAMPARAQPAPDGGAAGSTPGSVGISPADRAAIANTITAQIEAFRRDDAPAAFAYASPHIQQQFGTPDNFLAMVQRGYPPVYRPRSVQMRDLAVRDGQLVQRVDLIGPDGQAELAWYVMERGSDGQWRINGCQLTRSDMIGA